MWSLAINLRNEIQEKGSQNPEIIFHAKNHRAGCGFSRESVIVEIEKSSSMSDVGYIWYAYIFRKTRSIIGVHDHFPYGFSALKQPDSAG